LPDELNVDVDLWVQAPGDVPVGYSNQGSAIFNLLRDDLGHLNDTTDLNYEFSYSRGVPAGEYTVNLHLYRNLANVYPVPAFVAVSVKNSPNLPAQQILSTKLNLLHEDEELTALRFKLDEEGRLLSGSVHNLPRPLRATARR
jgi:hypothetical protein